MKKTMLKGLGAVVFGATILTGCGGKNKVESIAIKKGTFTYAYAKGDQVDVSGLKIIATYKDGSKKEISGSDINVSAFNTDTVGNQSVAIEYGGVTINVTVQVLNTIEESYDIYGVEQATALVTRKAKIIDAQGEEAYIDGGQSAYDSNPYIVGDDNPFIYRPNVTALHPETEEYVSLSRYQVDTEVYIKETNGYRLLTGTELKTYVTIDTLADSYDFTEAAIGKYFKITSVPTNLAASKKESKKQSIEFKVVDGLNVHNASELGYVNTYYAANWSTGEFENGSNTTQDVWKAYYARNGVTCPKYKTDDYMKGIVLHNNLSITPNDIPEEYIENIDGTDYLRDWVDLYTIGVEKNTTFNFYGNFFHLDFSNMTKVHRVVNGGQQEISHTEAFRFTAKWENDAEKVDLDTFERRILEDESWKTTYFNAYNVSLKGNANRSNDTSGFGGLIAFKAFGLSATLTNTNISTFMVNAYTEYAPTSLTLNKYKSYDAYQCAILQYGSQVLNVNDSIVKRTGGPIILAQNEYDENNTYANYSRESAPVITVTNTEFETTVTGQDAWFQATGSGSQMTDIAGMSMLFEDGHKFATADGKVNLTMILMPYAESANVTGNPQGQLKIDGVQVVDSFFDKEYRDAHDYPNYGAFQIKADATIRTGLSYEDAAMESVLAVANYNLNDLSKAGYNIQYGDGSWDQLDENAKKAVKAETYKSICEGLISSAAQEQYTAAKPENADDWDDLDDNTKEGIVAQVKESIYAAAGASGATDEVKEKVIKEYVYSVFCGKVAQGILDGCTSGATGNIEGAYALGAPIFITENGVKIFNGTSLVDVGEGTNAGLAGTAGATELLAYLTGKTAAEACGIDDFYDSEYVTLYYGPYIITMVMGVA